MLVVEIDGVDAETLQAGLAGLANVFRFAVEAPLVRIFGIAHDAEFGGDHELIASAFDGASDQFFIDEGAVDVGGVEER